MPLKMRLKGLWIGVRHKFRNQAEELYLQNNKKRAGFLFLFTSPSSPPVFTVPVFFPPTWLALFFPAFFLDRWHVFFFFSRMKKQHR